jgi:hypothetical protein
MDFLSDELVHIFVPDPDNFTRIRTIKGWVYVFVTGLIFYFIIKNRIDMFKEAERQVVDAYRIFKKTNEALRESEERYELVVELPMMEYGTGI